MNVTSKTESSQDDQEHLSNRENREVDTSTKRRIKVQQETFVEFAKRKVKDKSFNSRRLDG